MICRAGLAALGVTMLMLILLHINMEWYVEFSQLLVYPYSFGVCICVLQLLL